MAGLDAATARAERTLMVVVDATDPTSDIEEARCFITESVDPAERDGWLPERASRWIRRRSRESAGTVAAN
jgi:hypothetical protein